MGACVAIDIGAGSGRVIRGALVDGRLTLAEVYRFANGMEMVDGHLRWDVEGLYREVCEGLRRTGEAGPVDSIGLDTWGVDFALLDDAGRLMEQPVAYRDSRTDGVMESFFEQRMPREAIYDRTGIQFLPINTLYQLYSMRCADSPLLDRAARFLMMSDYLNYLLTGVAVNEFTNSTTTQMLNAHTGEWDRDILAAAGIREDLFSRPVLPGQALGPLAGEVARAEGLSNAMVYAVASHDTGSAVAAVPAEGKEWAYICSGTWCLMGIEVPEPATSAAALECNFTNEGGVFGTWRLLKNLMGGWLLQGLRKSFRSDLSCADLVPMAKAADPFAHIIHANDSRFLNPECMRGAFDAFLRETGQSLPATLGAYVRCAEEGLGFLYREVLEQLRQVQSRPIERLHILGGGAQGGLMCQIAADATGLPVLAGPVEGTAAGNLLLQLMAQGRLSDLSEARRVVRASFPMREFVPSDTDAWDRMWGRYLDIKGMTK